MAPVLSTSSWRIPWTHSLVRAERRARESSARWAIQFERVSRLNRVRLHAERATVLVGVGLAAVTVAAWVAFLAQAASPRSMAVDTMSAGPDLVGASGFIGAWVVMMAAMMLPSAAPLALLYRAAGADGRAANTVPLVAGYLLAWAGFGALVYAAQQALGAVALSSPTLGDARPYAVAGILAIAGVYQFTPLKQACLRQCRSPLDFLMHRWRGAGAFAAFRLGGARSLLCRLLLGPYGGPGDRGRNEPSVGGAYRAHRLHGEADAFRRAGRAVDWSWAWIGGSTRGGTPGTFNVASRRHGDLVRSVEGG